MAKFTADEKLQAVLRQLEGKESFNEIAQSLGADEKIIRVWKKQYEHNFVEAFVKRYTNYTLQFKLDVLYYMIENGTSLNETAAIFGIASHSTTKYIDGHGVSVGGAIIDSGNFDWMAYADKFPGLTTPDESYHGITYATKFGKGAYITKATAQLMRDFGCIQSPQNAFYINLGLESLPVRIKQHTSNGKAVAEFLNSQEKVAWVHYADLEGDEYHDLAKKYLPNGTCGVLSFAIKGGREKSIKFMDSLKLATIATHVADARTCLLHPASHTHRQLTDEQLEEAGISPDLIRYSCGLENAEDLIADLKQALDKI